jgi:hypothetical protein
MTKQLAKILLGIGLAAGLMTSAIAHGDKAKPSRTPVPEISITKGEKCVEPTEVMHKQHMEFILHHRDDTMRRGVRTTQHSLKNCVNCHADPESRSVLRKADGSAAFCASCHNYAAVSIDCFSCHTDKAEEKAANRGGLGAIGSRVMENTGGVK